MSSRRPTCQAARAMIQMAAWVSAICVSTAAQPKDGEPQRGDALLI